MNIAQFASRIASRKMYASEPSRRPTPHSATVATSIERTNPARPSSGRRRPKTSTASANAAAMLSIPSTTWYAARPKKTGTRGAGDARRYESVPCQRSSATA